MFTYSKVAEKWYRVPTMDSDGNESMMYIRHDNIVSVAASKGGCLINYDTGYEMLTIQATVQFDEFIKLMGPVD